MNWKGRTICISGASRGIGKAIGLRFAAEGANIVVTGKTEEPHPTLEGTIYSAAEEMEKAGGHALAVPMDIRKEEQIKKVVDQTIDQFGGIDVVINNASAIQLTGTEQTDMKRFDLMHQVNVRGTFLFTKYCIPHLTKSDHAHILTMSPPFPLEKKWFQEFLPYTLSKYGMTLCAVGWAQEFDGKIGVNTLWPATTIATAAIRNIVGGEEMIRHSRSPAIVADAAFSILSRSAQVCNGRWLTDEEVLREEGVTDFGSYAIDPAVEPMKDFFM